jgi:hypothetical protein
MCVGHVRFKAQELSYDAIMAAYAKGDFYASWGPEIKKLYLEDGVLKVTFPAASRVVRAEVHTVGRWAARKSGEGMTHAEFDLNGYIGEIKQSGFPLERAYFRLVVTDEHGDRALTRGYFLDEFESDS